MWSKGKCCDQVEWKKTHFNNKIDVYPCSLIWTNQIKTSINWNEEKIKNNNNIKVLMRTIFDILFRNTTYIKESEQSFPSGNPTKIGGGGVPRFLCKWSLWFRRKRMSLFGLTNLQSYPHQCDILLGTSGMYCFCYQQGRQGVTVVL